MPELVTLVVSLISPLSSYPNVVTPSTSAVRISTGFTTMSAQVPEVAISSGKLSKLNTNYIVVTLVVSSLSPHPNVVIPSISTEVVPGISTGFTTVTIAAQVPEVAISPAWPGK